MDIKTQINRGMERLICQREGARLEGLHGLSGMGCADTFGGLAGLLEESGFEGIGAHVGKLRRQHGAMCARVASALPVAVDALRLMESSGGNLSGFFSKVAKLTAKLSPSRRLLKHVGAAKLSPAQMLAARIAPKKKAKSQAQLDAAAAKKAAKAQAKATKKAAKAAAKQAKKDAKAAAALARANAQNLDPAAAGAAVLANESGVLATPQAQQFAQELVSNAAGPGGAVPEMSLTDAAPEGTEPQDTIFGIPKLWAIGGGVVLAVGAAYAMKRRGS